MQNDMPAADVVLERLVGDAQEDEATIGIILSGSRGAGCADAESDYDLLWVLTDAAYEQRKEQGEPLGLKTYVHGQELLDLGYTCPRELAEVASARDWRTPGFVTARVLLDKTGEVAASVQAIVTMPEEKAQADIPGWFDAYLNAYYRSMKAWRRGNELGGRLQAAESVMHLTRMLFALERCWPPYHDRLATQLDVLDGQGWPHGYLHTDFCTKR